MKLCDFYGPRLVVFLVFFIGSYRGSPVLASADDVYLTEVHMPETFRDRKSRVVPVPQDTSYLNSTCLSEGLTCSKLDPSRTDSIPSTKARHLTLVSRVNASVKPETSQSMTALHQRTAEFCTRNQLSATFSANQRRNRAWRTITQLSGGAEASSTGDIDGSIETNGETFTSQTNESTPRAFLGHFDTIRQKSLSLPRTILQRNEVVIDKVKAGVYAVQKTSTRMAPSFLSALSLLYASEKGISFLSLYAMSLLGSSCGFYLFLYFITKGYALGIGLPVSVALYVYNKHSGLTRASFFHSLLTVLWSARMLTFFIWREYISWPALHQKVVEIQSRMNIPFASRLLCWFVYSFFYVAMMSMNWSRLQQGQNAKWGAIGYTGLFMQVSGLALEVVADMQKNGFKSTHRHAWCNVGVWKWSTHPNYLGEGLFWWGTYLGHGFHSLPHSILATIGLGFIISVLKGSTRSLAIKHMEKYGGQSDFFEFQRTHGIWGPKGWWWWLHGMEELSKPLSTGNITILDGTNISTNTSTTEEAASLSAL